MEITLENNKGKAIISDEALCAIAINAAKDVDGVSSFSSKPIDVFSTIKQRSLKVMSPVRIIQDGSDISLNIYLNLQPDKVFKTVAKAVQKSVKEAVMNMTGTLVKKVNVIITGIDFSSPAKNEPTETEN